MAEEVVMPRLGWTMETGQVVAWHKRDGEQVTMGEVLFEVESDKSVNEIEALGSGVLRLLPGEVGIHEPVPIGTVLAYLVPEGEEIPTVPAAASAADEAGEETEEPEETDVAAPVLINSRRAWRGDPPASPRAKRAAKALGIDWRGLVGSGTSGRIVEQDVREAAARQAAAPQPIAPPPVAVPVAASEGEALGPVRRVVAQRMVASKEATAPVTLTTEADATELMRLRAQLAAAPDSAGGRVPSVVDLLARLTALALTEHPVLNASFVDERIVRHPAVHLGIAVETERGLLVPVLRDVQAKSVGQIAEESAALIAGARAGGLRPDALTGSTFTITNLGMYEIDAFTPIINLPECAILGVGRIVSRPVVIDEQTEAVAVRKMVALSLTFDHRIVDGAPAARFLQRIKALVEHPLWWLMR